MVGVKLGLSPPATVPKKPDHRGERVISCKPLRAERRVFWCICGQYARFCFVERTRMRVHQAPGVPTPFRGRDVENQTSREKSRGEIADLWLPHSPMSSARLDRAT